MSSIDIIILGVLMKSAQSAYHINKTIESNHVGDWLKISEPAVYRNIRKLGEKGYLSDHVERDGARPERRVYTITDAGRNHMTELIKEAAQSPVRIDFSFDAYLAHLDIVDRETGIKLLSELKQKIQLKRQEMVTIMRTIGPSSSLLTKGILDLRLRILQTTQEWAEDLYDYYIGNQIPHYGV